MRILLARPREDAERLLPKLVARGHEVVIEPLITIVPVPGATVPLDGVQAVLFTSANGVRAFAAASERRDLTVLAVGDATAEAARAAGFAKIESAGGDVDDLARLARARLDPAAGALLHAAGSAVAGDLAATLEAAGFTVHRAVLYGAWPVDRLSSAALELLVHKTVDVVVLFSPRSAETFVELIRRAGLQDGTARATLVGLSPAVIEAASGVPWADRLAAERPEEPALLAAIEGVAGGRRSAAAATPSPVEPAPAPLPLPPRELPPRRVGVALVLLVALAALGWAGLLELRARTGTADLEARLFLLEQQNAAELRGEGAVAGLAGRVDTVERQLQAAQTAQSAARTAEQMAGEARAALAALNGRVAALERGAGGTPAAVVPGGDIAQRLEAIERRLAERPALAPAGPSDVSARLEALEQRAGQPAAPAADLRSSEAITALERRIAALEATPRPAAAPGASDTERAANERRAAEMARADEAARQAEVRSAALAQRLAFTALRDAIGRGAPFAGELAALRTSAPERAAPLDPLQAAAARGIPTLAELTARFPAVASAVVDTSRPDGAWWWAPVERLRSMVQVRPVGDVAGDGPSAVVARAETRLAAGDLAGALAALEGLQGAAASAAAEWRAAAALRLQADALLARLDGELAGASR